MKVIHINPGPVFWPESETYQKRFTLLSNGLSGYIYTTTTSSTNLTISNFKFRAVFVKKKNALHKAYFLLFCVAHAVRLKFKGEQIDVVDSYDPLRTGVIAYIVSRILGSKLSIQVNGVYTSPAEWKDIDMGWVEHVKKRISIPLMRFLLCRADGVKLLFDGQINQLEIDWKGKVKSIFPSYVDIDKFYKRYTPNIVKNKKILFVGFPARRKGLDVLSNAYRLIAPTYPEWSLTVIGWYPDKTVLDEIFSGIENVNFQEPVSHDEMPKIMSEHSILVLPSRSEAMGRILVEGMAAGLARIGSNVDGIPTVINDFHDGLLFESENHADLADKLKMLIENEGLRRKISDNAIARAKKSFRPQIWSENTINYFTDLNKL